MKFIKKPVTIEAWQNLAHRQPMPDWLHAAIEQHTVHLLADGKMAIFTLEGTMTADVGDWIILGVKGELYPCKPDIFKATYDVDHGREHHMTIEELVRQAHNNSKEKGWWDDQKSSDPYNLNDFLVLKTIPEKLCLIHSEVSEALEDYREGKFVTTVNEPGKPEGFPSELADIVIRVADLAGALNIDLEQEIIEKMSFNRTRPHRHGGKTC